MRTKTKRKNPDIIVKDGKPSGVILDIKEYQRILERLEDVEDLKELEQMRKKPLKFRKLTDFIREYEPGV